MVAPASDSMSDVISDCAGVGRGSRFGRGVSGGFASDPAVLDAGRVAVAGVRTGCMRSSWLRSTPSKGRFLTRRVSNSRFARYR